MGEEWRDRLEAEVRDIAGSASAPRVVEVIELLRSALPTKPSALSLKRFPGVAGLLISSLAPGEEILAFGLPGPTICVLTPLRLLSVMSDAAHGITDQIWVDHIESMTSRPRIAGPGTMLCVRWHPSETDPPWAGGEVPTTVVTNRPLQPADRAEVFVEAFDALRARGRSRRT